MKEKIFVKNNNTQYEIPDSFIVWLGEGDRSQPLIKLGGLMYLANLMGKPILQTKNISKTDGERIYECVGYLIPNNDTLSNLGINPENLNDPRLSLLLGQPTIAHGTTNGDNLKGNMFKYAEVMAETRAIVRCLRLLTGCSYTAVEEMDKADLKDSIVTTNAADLYTKEKMGNAKDRETMTKELMVVMNEVPYSSIIARYYKENKTTSLSGLSNEVLAELYGKVITVLNSKR